MNVQLLQLLTLEILNILYTWLLSNFISMYFQTRNSVDPDQMP